MPRLASPATLTRHSTTVIGLAALTVGAVLAGLDGALGVTLAFGAVAVVLGVAAFLQCAAAMATTSDALDTETV